MYHYVAFSDSIVDKNVNKYGVQNTWSKTLKITHREDHVELVAFYEHERHSVLSKKHLVLLNIKQIFLLI